MNTLRILCFALAWLIVWSSSMSAMTESDKRDQPAPQQTSKGPHGGRLLQDGEVSLELAIFERGVPPEFRAWITYEGNIVSSASGEPVALAVDLGRLGGHRDSFIFTYKDDYWLGDGVVEEPHSFDVSVHLKLAGKSYRWAWTSYEGRVSLKPEIADKAGIRTVLAGPGRIQKTLTAYGSLVSGSENISHIRARYPGQITRVNVNVGDQVKQGQVLAQIESSESLKRYAIYAPIAGIVTQRHANTGELALAQQLFSITNLDNTWAELKIFPGQRALVRAGQTVHLTAAGVEQTSTIQQIVPTDNSPYVLARVPLTRADGDTASPWYPGQLVVARIVVQEIEVPLVVDKHALQNFRDWTVVFIQVDEEYEIRPLELGRGDKTHVEVLSGLNAGDNYVVDNSYLIKADIEKSGASHDH